MLSNRPPVFGSSNTRHQNFTSHAIFPIPYSHHQARPRLFFATATSNPRLPTRLVCITPVRSSLHTGTTGIFPLHFPSCQDIAFISCHDTRYFELNRHQGEWRESKRRKVVGTVCTLVATAMHTTTTTTNTISSANIYSLLLQELLLPWPCA